MAWRPLAPLGLGTLILALLATQGVARQPWHRVLYCEGLDAEAARRWGVAASYFNEALIEKNEDGERFLAGCYGDRPASYLPRFHLGQMLFELDRLDEALLLWETSLREKTLGSEERRAVERRLEKDFVGRCRNRLSWARQDLASAENLLLELKLQAQQKAPASKAGHQPFRTLLDSIGQRLVALDGRCARPLGGDSTLEALGALRQTAREIDAALEALVELRRKLQSQRDQAEEEGALDAKAQAAAFKRLAAEVLQGVPATPPDPGKPAKPPGWRLASTTAGEAGVEVWTPLEGALRAYLLAHFALEQRGCPDRSAFNAAVETLDRELHNWLPQAKAAGFSYEPEWNQARAAMYCGDRQAATRLLREGSQMARLKPRQAAKLETWVAESAPLGRVENKRFALLMGAQSYRHHQPLNATRDDLTAIRRALERQGFQVPDDRELGAQPHIDRTRDEILSLAKRFFNTYGPDEEATLLLYWVGHGYTGRVCVGSSACDDRTKAAFSYLLPFDLKPFPTQGGEGGTAMLDFLDEHALEMKTLRDWATEIRWNYRSALFVIDSCSSGMLIDNLEPMPRGLDRQTAREPVRMFIASGVEDQPVSASSRFREAFVEGIEGCADDNDGEEEIDGKDLHVTGDELAEFLRKKLAYERSDGLAGRIALRPYNLGDFVLDVPSPPSSCQSDEMVETALDSLDLIMEAYAQSGDPKNLEQLLLIHLKTFKQRHFEALIRVIQQRLSPTSRKAHRSESTQEPSAVSPAKRHR